jgi:hypothetical protein
VACATLSLGPGSMACVARVTEVRAEGAARPAPDAQTETSQERRAGGSDISTSTNGATLDVTVSQVTECRDVTSTERMVREVDIRRSFANPEAQSWDVALTSLAIAGSAFLFYNSEGPWACASSCSDTVGYNSAPFALAVGALAAIPLAFVAYNAARVQDESRIEAAPPASETGAWSACERRPLPDQDVVVMAGDSPLRARTGADGRASFAMSFVRAAAKTSTVTIQHAGSPDVVVDLDAAPAAR